MRPAGLLMACALVLLPLGCGEGPEEGDISTDRTAEPPGGADDGEPSRPAPEPVRETVSGQAVYSANCAACHGQDGAGEGPASVGLEPPPSDLTDSAWTAGDGSLAAIRNTVENGSPGTAMIAWQGTLTEAEIEAVSRYVQSLGGGNP